MFIAVIVFAGYLAYQEYQVSKNQDTLKSQTPMTNVQSNANDQNSNTENADWKTYINNEGKFSLEYPSHWKLDDRSNEGYIEYGPNKNVIFTGEEGYLQVSYGNSFGGMCPQGYEKIQIGSKEFDVCHSVENDIENWSVSGKQFGNFAIGMFITANKPYLSNRVIILKMLSTFKFTN